MNLRDKFIEQYRQVCAGESPLYVKDEKTGKIEKKIVKGHGNIFPGSGFHTFITPFLKEYVKTQTQALTILDYGSGSAEQLWNKNLKVTVFDEDLRHAGRDTPGKTFYEELAPMVQCYWAYDPALPYFNRLPPEGMKFDVVTCTEVVEHIPEPYLKETFGQIRSYMHDDGFAMFSTCNAPAVQSFLDGTNFHVTLKPLEYWDALMQEYFDRYVLFFIDNYGNFKTVRRGV